MSANELSRIEKRIEKIKEALAKIGPMRPGSLSRQYKDPEAKSGPYWQISYTRNMQSRTEYVRQDCVAEIRKEITAYKRFRKLMEEWVDRSIEASKLRMKVDKKTGSE
jgi:hypothetical protein